MPTTLKNCKGTIRRRAKKQRPGKCCCHLFSVSSQAFAFSLFLASALLAAMRRSLNVENDALMTLFLVSTVGNVSVNDTVPSWPVKVYEQTYAHE